MAEVVDKAIRDWESVKIFSEDGSGSALTLLYTSLAVLAY